MSLSLTTDRASPTSRIAALVRARFPLAVALLGFALTVATFWPGWVPPDADDQFAQALAFRFTDWHPPVMGVVWAVLNRIHAGPEPMMLVQAGLYWAAVWCVLASLKRELSRGERVFAILALASPVMVNFLGVVLKDVQLMAAWTFVAALCHLIRRRDGEPGPALKILLGLLVIYGVLLRQNAALVAGPLVLYLVIGRGWTSSLWRTLAAWVAIAIVGVGFSAGLNRLVRAEHTPVLSSLFMFDFAGLSLHTGENVFPFPVSADEMRRVGVCYQGGLTHDDFVWGDCKFIHERSQAPGLDDGTVMRDWLGAIARHPLAYLAHRTAHFTKFLGIATIRPAWDFWIETWPGNKHGFATDRHPLYWLLKGYVYAALATPLMRIGFWLAAALALGLWAARKPGLPETTRAFVVTGTTTAVLYLLTYYPFGVAPPFRYAYVAIALTSLSACALAPELVALARGWWAKWRTRRRAEALPSQNATGAHERS